MLESWLCDTNVGNTTAPDCCHWTQRILVFYYRVKRWQYKHYNLVSQLHRRRRSNQTYLTFDIRSKRGALIKEKVLFQTKKKLPMTWLHCFSVMSCYWSCFVSAALFLSSMFYKHQFNHKYLSSCVVLLLLEILHQFNKNISALHFTKLFWPFLAQNISDSPDEDVILLISSWYSNLHKYLVLWFKLEFPSSITGTLPQKMQTSPHLMLGHWSRMKSPVRECHSHINTVIQ